MTSVTYDPPVSGLSRTVTSAFLNGVANHADVRPWLGGDLSQPIDLSATVAATDHVALEGESGGFLGLRLLPGWYDIHSLFLPEGRGHAAVRAARHGLRYLFVETDAVDVVTRVPANNPAALGLARMVGFQERYTIPGGWPTADGPVDLGIWGLTLERWWLEDRDVLARGGLLAGLLPDYASWPAVSQRALGALGLLAAHGNVLKGVDAFNRHALLAGVPGTSLLQLKPVIIQVGTAVVAIGPTRAECLSCR